MREVHGHSGAYNPGCSSICSTEVAAILLPTSHDFTVPLPTVEWTTQAIRGQLSYFLQPYSLLGFLALSLMLEEEKSGISQQGMAGQMEAKLVPGQNS